MSGSKSNKPRRSLPKKRKISTNIAENVFSAEFDVFIQEISQLFDDKDTDKDIELHSLYKESLVVIKKFIQRSFRVRLQIKKKEHELTLLMNPKTYLKLRNDAHWAIKLTGIQVPHHILNEKYQENLLQIEIGTNYNILEESKNVLKSCLDYTYDDMHQIIDKICGEYKNYIEAMKSSTASAKWCPQSLQSAANTIKDNSKKQNELFIKYIRKYESHLETEFNELSLQKHLSIDYCHKFLFQRNKKNQNRKQIQKSNLKKLKYYRSDLKEEANRLIDDRIKRLYLQSSASIINMAPSYKAIRTRRAAVKVLFNAESANPVNLKEIKLHILRKKIRIIIEKEQDILDKNEVKPILPNPIPPEHKSVEQNDIEMANGDNGNNNNNNNKDNVVVGVNDGNSNKKYQFVFENHSLLDHFKFEPYSV